MHILTMITSLAMFWLLLSGHYTPLLLGFGALSCLLVSALCHRMDIVDHESHPHHLWRRIPSYWFSLTIDTLKSNWDVAKILINPRSQPHPSTEYVDTPLKDDVSRAILANSITLTPGTLTLNVEDERMLVHALEPAFMDDLRQGGMIERAARLEDEC